MGPDAKERKQQLRVKLSANAQRNARFNFLKRLPDDLSAYLERCEFIQSPELDQLTDRFVPYPNGTGSPDFRPSGYIYREFSWPEQIFETIKRTAPSHPDSPAYFWPCGTNPIYRVCWGWVMSHIENLWEYCPEQLGVTAEDFSVGVLISNYCGYLPEDPNPHEVVYELGMWG